MSDYSLCSALDTHVSRTPFYLLQGGGRDEGDGFFHPSEASVVITNELGEREVLGGCLRSSWYRAKGGFQGEGREDTYLSWTAKHGKALEIMLIEMLKEMGVWLADSVPFIDRTYGVKGELDCIIQEPGLSKPTVLECKSFWGWSATKELLGSKRPPRKGAPKDAHLLQACIYLHFFQEQVARAKLLYFARDNDSRHTEFDIVLRQEPNLLEAISTRDIYIRGRGEEGYKQETRFGTGDILRRFVELKESLNLESPPPRDHALIWTPEEVEREWKRGNVTKGKYEEWQKGKRTLGHYLCRRCRYRGPCYPDQQVEEENEE